MIIYLPFNGYGGSQLMSNRFIKTLIKHDIKTRLVVGFGDKGFLENYNPEITTNNKYLRLALLPFLSLILNLRFAINNRPIIGITTYSIYSLILPSLLFPHKVSVYLHEIPKWKFVYVILKFLKWKNVELIFVSHFHRNQIGLQGRVIYNYIDLKGSNPSINPSKRLIFVGSGNFKKGFDRYLNLCNKMAKDGFKFDAYLNSINNNYKKKALDLGVNIQLNIIEKDAFFEEGGIMIQPSRAEETFSLTTLEAASWGIPVITFNLSVAKELLPNSVVIDVKNLALDEIRCTIMNLIADNSEYNKIANSLKADAKKFNKSKYEQNIKKLKDEGFFNRN